MKQRIGTTRPILPIEVSTRICPPSILRYRIIETGETKIILKYLSDTSEALCWEVANIGRAQRCHSWEQNVGVAELHQEVTIYFFCPYRISYFFPLFLSSPLFPNCLVAKLAEREKGRGKSYLVHFRDPSRVNRSLQNGKKITIMCSTTWEGR